MRCLHDSLLRVDSEPFQRLLLLSVVFRSSLVRFITKFKDSRCIAKDAGLEVEFSGKSVALFSWISLFKRFLGCHMFNTSR